MDISIIIPAFQEKVLLGRLLQSIQDGVATLPAGSVEVLVVDDGSKPPLGAFVAPFQVRYFYIRHGGAAAARNYGATHAWGDAYFFLDSDTELLPDTLRKVLQIVRRPDFGVSSIPHHPRSANPGVVPEFKALFDAYNVWHRVPRGPIPIINGSSVLFRRQVFHELGGWDGSRRRSQCDNEEFSVRIKRRYPIIHEPDVFVAHTSQPRLRALMRTIFYRTISWTRGVLNKKVEFDGLTRTPTTGVVALMPLLCLASLVASLVWPQALWVAAGALVGFAVGNTEFFAFMGARAGISRTLRYAATHFAFTLAVGAGAVVGFLTAWKAVPAVAPSKDSISSFG